MKLFDHGRYRKILLLGLALVFTAGTGMYFSLASFLSAGSGPGASEARIWTLFAASILATCVVILSSLALFRGKDLLQRRTHSALARFQLIAERSGDLVTILKPSGRIEYVNRAVEEVTGYAREELVGKRTSPRLPWYLHSDLYRTMQSAVLAGDPFTIAVECRRKDGQPFTIEEHVEPFHNGSRRITRLISTARNITREKDLEHDLRYLDRHDPLTGFPNRRSVLEMLDQAIVRARSNAGQLSVLIMDINRFKHVNDLFGPDAGDTVLKRVAERLRSSLPAGDLVARSGSDEFVIIHPEDRLPITAGATAQKIRATVTESIAVDGKSLVVTPTIGISVYPEHGDDAWTLLKNADLALARSKSQGRNMIQFYEEGIGRQIAEFFILERSLFSALRNNEYLLHYQPYCDLSSRQIAGAEALIKWNNPDHGVVSPAKFIPLLEDTGMIIDVGRWVLETACGRIKEWERISRPFPVSVNLSLAQFRHKYLVGMVRDTINDFRLDPRRLTLEVTESVFMHDMEFAVQTLKRLKDTGVTISVDDFGTGYSSLSYIRRLPVDNLKIDISFVRDVARDQDAASIVSAITTLARNLNLKTIAEGVETEEQCKILHLLRCDMGQGFLFSPAVPAEELEKMVMRQ